MSEESIDQGINLSSSELKITEYIRKDLTTAAKWGKFLAIIGFVVVGLMFIAALFMLISAATMPSFISGQFFLFSQHFIYCDFLIAHKLAFDQKIRLILNLG